MATVLVTGANRGIGYAIVQAIGTRFPASTVLLGCRTTDAGEQAIEELKTGGIRANLHAIQIDIEDDDSIAASAASVRERFGKLDVLINNAIKLDVSKGQEPREIRKAANANYNNGITSNALVTHGFLPLLRKSAWPRVIMVSSTRGSFGKTVNQQLPPVANVNYCVVKAALNMLTVHLQAAEDAKDEGDRVTFWSVNPGHCKTGFNGFRGLKDPLDGAEVVIRLMESEKGAVAGGTFWELEQGEFRPIPW